jgi:hypothetical protein
MINSFTLASIYPVMSREPITRRILPSTNNTTDNNIAFVGNFGGGFSNCNNKQITQITKIMTSSVMIKKKHVLYNFIINFSKEMTFFPPNSMYIVCINFYFFN